MQHHGHAAHNHVIDTSVVQCGEYTPGVESH